MRNFRDHAPPAHNWAMTSSDSTFARSVGRIKCIRHVYEDTTTFTYIGHTSDARLVPGIRTSRIARTVRSSTPRRKHKRSMFARTVVLNNYHIARTGRTYCCPWRSLLAMVLFVASEHTVPDDFAKSQGTNLLDNLFLSNLPTATDLPPWPMH